MELIIVIDYHMGNLRSVSKALEHEGGDRVRVEISSDPTRIAQADRVVVTSTKSMTGHLLGGAGALESIATVMALHDRTVPPTINLDDKDPQVELDIATKPRDLPEGQIAALNNSFGFGGANVAVAFGTV